ncbi:hypothetical protein SAMN05421810_102355 [Amycolatopsis arida]|uniref:Protein phosphatase 2C n=1 Tax=Amycolatopsis arida TaxID=587909 RepID=A0A1I5PP88_9PSEU|nr:hypothetical protein [Amycolatopsis arida]TDX98562.1 hypothetical protein CLV69_101355 [Amycolatopsis arida]SFP35918.1 hypothetical protein SAMN05421810_102355 [Amycolatopsis arida]
MRVATAQLPGGDGGDGGDDSDDSDDRVFTTGDAVIVLDGASAFLPVPVPAATYADVLGKRLRDLLNAGPDRGLRDVLADGIAHTATVLGLSPGDSPSSTVTIVRQRDDDVDVLILGDNLVVLPDEVLTDDRMDQLDLPPRRRYRERLADGHGYDEEHQATVREQQVQQAERRNRPGGYWIAEADPAAAEHAILTRRPVREAPWAVLATDGAYNTMDYLGLDDWTVLAHADATDLADALRQCDTWEAHGDPTGQALPRPKRHDDKTLAAVLFGPDPYGR